MYMEQKQSGDLENVYHQTITEQLRPWNGFEMRVECNVCTYLPISVHQQCLEGNVNGNSFLVAKKFMTGYMIKSNEL